MNTTALVNRLLQVAARPFLFLFAFLKKLTLAMFGRLQWSPPRWLSQSRAAFSQFNRAHPLQTFFGLVAIFLLSCGAAWTLHWYQHRPIPHKVTATIASPSITKLEKELKYPTLTIRFSEPAARLEDLKKASLQGVQLEPKVAGVWSWNSDKELAFRPSEDWPADQKFKITFARKFFPSHVLMERIIAPAAGTAYEVLNSGSSRQQGIPLRAKTDADVREVYWFADKNFIGKSTATDILSWKSAPGRYELTALDDHGRAGSCKVTVR